MSFLNQIIGEIEIHSAEGIKTCFSNGVSPNDLYNNKPLIYELINEYSRGPSFSKCIQVFIDHGLRFDDQVLLAVLANNPGELKRYLEKDPGIINRRYDLDCTFTPYPRSGLSP